MNNETQPTPEQLAKWRVKFESRYDLSQLGKVYNRYLNQDVREAWGNYVEAREDALQENEQVMKLAKFGAMILSVYKEGYVSDEEIGNFALSSGCITKPIEAFAPNIEAKNEAGL